ncbi:MAG: DNA/RNA nuclease SfsA [Methanocellales archaeon]|nr:DNA/RNA nuclease SfsA [Methanocellales archaeon]
MTYKFKEKLIEGIIKSRPNRFVMLVDINNSIFKCHCPSTGRIGNIDFKDVPCLVSKANIMNRATSYTVEAVSLDPFKKKHKKWIGINQTKVNAYIEFFIKNNCFPRIVKNGVNVKRERKLGNSRIDFKVEDTFIEVKMPLIQLPSDKSIPEREYSKFNSFDRMIKHFKELSDSINKNSRAILLLCYMYDAEPFRPPPLTKDNIKIHEVAKKSVIKGVENWQVNLKIDKEEVKLIKYFRLNLFPNH